ncbi:MAG: ArsR/SmtB family transcription factor [Candidatus Thorarchaeota archaeon]
MSKKRNTVPIVIQESELDDVVRIFKALADRTRVKIISLLTQQQSHCVSAIAKNLDLTISNVSHQLRKLVDLRFVKHTKVGKNVYYSLDDECIRSILGRAKDHVAGN